MRLRSLVPVLMLALESGADETGLSKGPADPADLGSRCSVMAGREDRAYLDCGRRAPGVSTATDIIPLERWRIEHFGASPDGTARRYPLRAR